MNRLTGATLSYKSHDTAGINDRGERVDIKVAIRLLDKEMAPETIKLKVGNVSTHGLSSTNFLPLRSGARLC
jgi:hypothetical protein